MNEILKDQSTNNGECRSPAVSPELSGQDLSDAAARMMGWEVVGHYWGKYGDSKDSYLLFHGRQNWKPHTDFNQCRIVEDWISSKGLWIEFISVLNCHPLSQKMRSTSEDRLQAALALFKPTRKK